MAENQNVADQASTLNDERASRLAKRAALFEAGQNPYPEHSEIEDYVVDIEAKYADLADGEDTEDVVKIGGRVVAKRGQGKIMFIVVRDATAEIQLFCRINDMDEAAWNTLKALDLGDILGVTGVVVRTKRGQLSVAPKSATLLSKAVRPMPEKFHGLSDKETRYRQRYVDLIANDDVRETFRKRSQILSTFRRFMEFYFRGGTCYENPFPDQKVNRSSHRFRIPDKKPDIFRRKPQGNGYVFRRIP